MGRRRGCISDKADKANKTFFRVVEARTVRPLWATFVVKAQPGTAELDLQLKSAAIEMIVSRGLLPGDLRISANCIAESEIGNSEVIDLTEEVSPHL
jgi:hypothetical protein